MAKKNNDLIIIGFGIVAIILVLSLVGSYAYFLISHNLPAEGSNQALFNGFTIDSPGVFGDSFGILAALFSGLAFALLIVTLLLQREDLKLQRDELALTRDEIKKQSFESTFFQMLRIHNDILNSIDLDHWVDRKGEWPATNDSTLSSARGRDCFVKFMDLLNEEYVLSAEILRDVNDFRNPHSRSKCNSGDLGWGFIAQAFPGSVVNT